MQAVFREALEGRGGIGELKWRRGGKNHYLMFMQNHPVCCHYQTRPTGVPEVVVLDDAGVVAFSLV